MRRMTARYRVATPLFLAGASPKGDPELRASSFKGVLRFWYRAAALPRLGSWEEVRKEEEELFGGAGRGQGAFLLTLAGTAASARADRQWESAFPYAAYLGYGINADRRKPARGYYEPGSTFRVDFLFKPSGNKDEQDRQIRSVTGACEALGLFGGLGSRSRRGYGSVCLESLTVDGEEQWASPTGPEALQKKIEGFLQSLGGLSPDLPPYSAFSRHSRIVIVPGRFNDSIALLDHIGREMMLYRSYGRKNQKTGRHQVGNKDALQMFWDDHDLVQDFIRNRNAAGHPRRVAFGLPHNYFFSSLGNARVDINAAEDGRARTADAGRRASPLFIHVQALGGNQYAAVLSLLGAAFLPGGRRILLKEGRDKALVPVDEHITEYRVVHDFLSFFPERLEVKL